MAEIVAAGAMPHILMSPKGIEKRAQRVVNGMLHIGRAIRQAKPDVLVVIANDHLFNMDLHPIAAFQVGTAESYEPFGDMDIPRKPAIPGEREFAEGLIAAARGQGLPVAALPSVRPDHGVAVPLLFANPARDIPVVPVYVNYMLDPVPSPQQCWHMGMALKTYIASRPKRERVAVLGTGGLSHWIGVDPKGVNESFDLALMDDFTHGRAEEWAGKSSQEIEKLAGNGGLEISNWLMAIAAAGANPNPNGFRFYEPMPEWLTGMGGMMLKEEATN